MLLQIRKQSGMLIDRGSLAITAERMYEAGLITCSEALNC